MPVVVSLSDTIEDAEVLELYKANALSDGHLVVYFPHMLVHPDFQRRGIGRKIMTAMLDKYGSFHQLMLVADGDAIAFYQAMGFSRAGKTEPMWIYAGHDH